MTNSSGDPRAWVGRPVTAADGEPVGPVSTVYTDPATGALTWAAVDVGAGTTALVPLDRATVDGQGLRVAYAAGQVRTAPAFAPGTYLSGPLQAQLEDALGG